MTSSCVVAMTTTAQKLVSASPEVVFFRGLVSRKRHWRVSQHLALALAACDLIDRQKGRHRIALYRRIVWKGGCGTFGDSPISRP